MRDYGESAYGGNGNIIPARPNYQNNNTGRIYYNGFYYTADRSSWAVYDFAGSLLQSGRVSSFAANRQSAIDWIDSQLGTIEEAPEGNENSEQNLDDDGEPEGNRPPTDGGGGSGVVDIEYPHDMYNCETSEKYVAYSEVDHNLYTDLGYVHDLSECKINNDPGMSDFSVIGILAGIVILGAVF